MSHTLFRLAAQLQNKPLLATEDLAATALSYLNRRMTGQVTPNASVNLKPIEGRAEDRVSELRDGVAFINIFGGLTHRMDTMDAICTGGLSSYQGLERAFDEAVADKTVEKIVLMIDSGGGEAAGCFELARHIKEQSNGKPVIAYVDSRACSAAYALACSASEIYAAPNTEVGSIGVIVIHQEFSKALEKEGIVTNILKAGEVKGMGNPFEPLSKEARGLIQKSVDNYYSSFVKLVSDSRSIPEKAIEDTGARVYSAEDALGLKLIDGIKTTDEFKEFVLGAEANKVSRAPVDNQPHFSEEEIQMDLNEKKAYEDRIAALEAQVAATAQASAVAEMQPKADVLGIDASAAVSAIASVGADSEAGKFMSSLITSASAKIVEVKASAAQEIASNKAEMEETHQAALKAISGSAAMQEIGSEGQAAAEEQEPVNESSLSEYKTQRDAALKAAIAKLNVK